MTLLRKIPNTEIILKIKNRYRSSFFSGSGFCQSLISTILFTGISLNCFAENYSGTIYEQNSQQQKKLFSLQVIDVSPTETQSVYKDLEGKVVIEEKTLFKEGQFQKFEIDQKQLQQKAFIELKDGKVLFSKTDSAGETSVKEEKVGKTFVVAATFRAFVKDHIDEIKAGKTVEFRYGVWDRQETIGFQVAQDKVEKKGSEEVIVLKMKPSSFLISALVKPLFFKFSQDGKRLLELNGRVAPKMKNGEKWKDLDAEIVYSYE